MSMLAFFEWCESTAVGTTIRESVWLFPVIEAVHLVALTVLGGAALVVDLRLLGWVLPRVPVARMARDARPWLLGALAVLLLTGLLLFLSEAVKCYYNTAFWVKMTSLLLAIIFVLTVRQKMTLREPEPAATALKPVALVSMALWFTVAAAGRWIGFS